MLAPAKIAEFLFAVTMGEAALITKYGFKRQISRRNRNGKEKFCYFRAPAYPAYPACPAKNIS